MASKISKTDAAVNAIIDAMRNGGAVLVLRSDAMGRSAYYLRGADGVEAPVAKMVGYALPLGQMRRADDGKRGPQVWALR